MHTYGIGSGVSIDLVKGCAKAGNGTCTFIENSNDIENKVLSSLQKDNRGQLNLQHCNLLDKDHMLLVTLVEDKTISHGDKFCLTKLFEG